MEISLLKTGDLVVPNSRNPAKLKETCLPENTDHVNIFDSQPPKANISNRERSPTA